MTLDEFAKHVATARATKLRRSADLLERFPLRDGLCADPTDDFYPRVARLARKLGHEPQGHIAIFHDPPDGKDWKIYSGWSSSPLTDAELHSAWVHSEDM